ncbi:MAG: hypothetical protein WCG10_06770, partial [Chlamydiota bacterium]
DVFFSAPSTPISSRSSTPTVEQLSESEAETQSIALNALSNPTPDIENPNRRLFGNVVQVYSNLIERVRSTEFTTLSDDAKLDLFIECLIGDDTNDFEKASITFGLIQNPVPEEDRDDFILQVRSLVTHDMASAHKTEVIVLLAEMSKEERANFVLQVRSLMTQDMDGYNRYCVTIALKRVNSDHRDDFVNQIVSIVRYERMDQNRVECIEVLARMSVEDRANAISELISYLNSNAATHVEEDFIVDADCDFQTQSIQLLLNFFEQILANNHRLPRVQYTGSKGIDAGGLTRDFISRLFRSLCGQTSRLPMKIEDEGLLLKYDKKASLSIDEQIASFKAIGTIFGAALVNQGFTTGLYFHPVMFKMISSLSLDEIDGVPNNLDNPQMLHKPLKPLLMALYPAQFPDADALDEALANNTELETLGTTVSEFLDDYPELEQIVLAIITIAKAMKEHLGEDDVLKLLLPFEELSNRIQGIAVSRENILTSLGNDPSADQLKRWVDQATDDQLNQFVFFITGSRSLHPGVPLSVNLLNASFLNDGAFVFHTCSKTIDIMIGQSDADFKLRLDASLEGEEAPGFNLA